MKNISKISDKKIVLCISLILLILLWPVRAIIRIAGDAGAETKVYAAENVRLSSFADRDGWLYSTDGDPQIIINFDTPQKITEVEVDIEYGENPGIVVLYYNMAGQTDFSEFNRIAVKENFRRPFTVAVHKKNVSTLRIDPMPYAGRKIKINSITVNAHKPMAEYFAVSFYDVFCYAVITGFTVTVCLLLKQLICGIRYGKE